MESAPAFRTPASVVTTSQPLVLDRARIYVIGDIHGRSDLLDRMVDHISRELDANPCSDCMTMTLGDYIDRGPDSRGVLDRFVRNPFPTDFVALIRHFQERAYPCRRRMPASLSRGGARHTKRPSLPGPRLGRRWRQREDCAIIVQRHRSALTAKEVIYDAPHSCIAGGARDIHPSVVRPKHQPSHGSIWLYDRH